MQNSVRSATRMDGVQAPIIPVVGDIIRQVPGTISLGQGVVHYGPPPEAARGGAAGADRSGDARVSRTAPDMPELVEADRARSWRAENGIDVARGSAHHGHRRREHGVHARRARDHRARRRDHPAGAVLFQSRDGDPDGRMPAPSRVADRRRYQPRSRRDSRAPSRTARARSSRSRRTIRRGAVFPEALLREVNDAVPRSRAVPHHRRGLRVLHLRIGAARVARVAAGRRRAHDLDVLAVEGVRLRRLAHRLHGVPGAT